MHLFTPARSNDAFPFHPSSGPIFAHPGWNRARIELLNAVRQAKSAALLGPAGSGKSFLLQDLARTLNDDGCGAHLLQRGDALELSSWTSTLLIDEAGRIGPELLKQLCTIDVPFVVAALTNFADRLATLPRPVEIVVLHPLSPEEVAQFLSARLTAAGRSCDLLEPGAVLALADRSGGLLRSVNILAGAALFLAELEGSARVRERHVEEAAAISGTEEDNAVAAEAGADRSAVITVQGGTGTTREAGVLAADRLLVRVNPVRTATSECTDHADDGVSLRRSKTQLAPLLDWLRVQVRAPLRGLAVGLGVALTLWTVSAWRFEHFARENEPVTSAVEVWRRDCSGFGVSRLARLRPKWQLSRWSIGASPRFRKSAG